MVATEKTFATEFNNLVSIAKAQTTAHHISANFSDFCPYLQFITFDALDPKDYPNGIDKNSVYVTFTINYQTKKVELHSFGHCWLSPKDKQHPKYKYYAMRSIVDIAKEDYNVAKFRKQTFKDEKDLFNRMEKYYKAVMTAIKAYTGGYPYKEGITLPTEEKAA